MHEIWQSNKLIWYTKNAVGDFHGSDIIFNHVTESSSDTKVYRSFSFTYKWYGWGSLNVSLQLLHQQVLDGLFVGEIIIDKFDQAILNLAHV